MDLIQALCRGPQQWRGLGRNHEDEEFTGRLELQPLVEERGVLLRYRALRLPDGRLVHEEATLLARDAEGQLCLWPVMSELPGIWCHRIVLPAGGTMRPPTRGAAGRSASPPARATTPRASARRSGWCWIRRANCTAPTPGACPAATSPSARPADAGPARLPLSRAFRPPAAPPGSG
jgi:hypothetical protein